MYTEIFIWYQGWRRNDQRIPARLRFFIDEDELAKVKTPGLNYLSFPVDYKTNDILAFNAKSLKGCRFSGCWRSSIGELVADRAFETDLNLQML